MIDFTQIGMGLLAPAALAFGLMLIAGRLPMVDKRLTSTLGWVVSLLAGLTWGFIAARGWPALPPRVGAQWLVVAVLPLVAMATLVQLRLHWSSWQSVTVLMRVILAGGMAWALLGSYVRYHWTQTQAVTWLAGLTVLGVAMWQWQDALARRSHRPRSLLTMALVHLALGVTIMGSGSLVDGQYALASGGVMLAAVLASRKLPVQTIHVAGVGLMWLNGLALLIFGVFYAEVTLPAAGLILASFCLAGLTTWPWLTRSRKRQAVAQVIALSPALVAAAAASWQAWHAMQDNASWVLAW